VAHPERLILARHPHHVTHASIVLFEVGFGRAGQLKLRDSGGERSDSKQADKTRRSAQAWGGLVTRRLAAPVRLLSTPSCGTGGKEFVDRPSLPSPS
jgi:hypothetical protein